MTCGLHHSSRPLLAQGTVRSTIGILSFWKSSGPPGGPHFRTAFLSFLGIASRLLGFCWKCSISRCPGFRGLGADRLAGSICVPPARSRTASDVERLVAKPKPPHRGFLNRVTQQRACRQTAQSVFRRGVARSHNECPSVSCFAASSDFQPRRKSIPPPGAEFTHQSCCPFALAVPRFFLRLLFAGGVKFCPPPAAELFDPGWPLSLCQAASSPGFPSPAPLQQRRNIFPPPAAELTHESCCLCALAAPRVFLCLPFAAKANKFSASGGRWPVTVASSVPLQFPGFSLAKVKTFSSLDRRLAPG